MRASVIELDHTRTCRSTLFNCTNKQQLATDFASPPRTVSATLHSTDCSYHSEKVEKCHSSWNQKKCSAQRITLRDARTVPVASPSAMISQLNLQCDRSMSKDSPYRACNNHKTQSPKNQCKTIPTEERCREYCFQGISAFTWGSDQTILL